MSGIVHDVEPREEVKELHRAKAKMGQAIAKAIEGEPLKAFGHEGLVSAVTSGEKVPGYLARMHQNKTVRRRLALALLEDDTGVVVVTTITFPAR